MLKEIYKTKDSSFIIELSEQDASVDLIFIGKSKDRSPSEFINPVLMKAYDTAKTVPKEIVLNFYRMSFMNSSTVAPIIKLWSMLKNESIPLRVVFNADLSWQKTSFAPLAVFHEESDLFTLESR